MAALSLTRKEVIHVAFVALGDGFRRRLDAVANHIRASTSHAVQFHAIVSAEPPPPPSSVPSCCRLHMVGDAPPLVHAQHRNLTNRRAVKTAAFLWKPFLFRVLTDIDRVIVLDFDVVLHAPVHHLWRLFDGLAPAVLALAHDNGAPYRSWGTPGFNGGVQLHHLARMRGHQYSVVLGDYAAGRHPEWTALEPSLGDQTLFTHICLRHDQLCRTLPCGWNRQLNTGRFAHSSFARDHSCSAACSLTHYNQPLLEQLLPALQRREGAPSCAACRAAVAQLKNHTQRGVGLGATQRIPSNARWRWGPSKEFMGGVIERCCCAEQAEELSPLPVPEGGVRASFPSDDEIRASLKVYAVDAMSGPWRAERRGGARCGRRGLGAPTGVDQR